MVAHVSLSTPPGLRCDSQANFHVVCGWLTQEIVDRCAAGSRVGIWNGVGGADAARAVGAREVDLAISTPAALARLALEECGLHSGHPIRELHAIGVLPQNDRLIFAIPRDHDIHSFAQLRERKPKRRLAISIDDGNAGATIKSDSSVTACWKLRGSVAPLLRVGVVSFTRLSAPTAVWLFCTPASRCDHSRSGHDPLVARASQDPSEFPVARTRC